MEKRAGACLLVDSVEANIFLLRREYFRQEREKDLETPEAIRDGDGKYELA